MKPRNLRIRHRNRVPGPVILLLGHHLRLIGEVVEACLDLLHETVEVPAESGERVPVEKEEALRGRARCRP